MSDKEAFDPTRKMTHQEHLRFLVARAAGHLIEQNASLVDPKEGEAVQQTIDTFRWLTALQNDANENYRGGTLDKKDVPMPEPPTGHLVVYILRTMNIID